MVDGESPTLFADCWSLAATLLQWLTELPPWNIQDLCLRYQHRYGDREVASLRSAMENEEEPSVVQHLDPEIDFFRDCFSYQVSGRTRTGETSAELTSSFATDSRSTFAVDGREARMFTAWLRTWRSAMSGRTATTSFAIVSSACGASAESRSPRRRGAGQGSRCPQSV